MLRSESGAQLDKRLSNEKEDKDVLTRKRQAIKNKTQQLNLLRLPSLDSSPHVL